MSSSAHEHDEHDCTHLHDCAAYVLRAFAEAEAEKHREHLLRCPICRAEVEQLQPVADALAVGVPAARSDRGARARVLAAVHAERERHDATATAPVTAAAPATPARSGRRTPRWPARLLSGSSRLQPARLLPVVGVLAVGVGVAIGAIVFGSSGATRAEVIRAVVVEPGRRATAELRKVGVHLELVVVGMPSPPPGRIYEVWLEHGAEAPIPTDALFSVTRSGSGSVGVPGNLHGVSKVLVTDEPLGGSLKPTRTPVIVGSV